MLPNTAVRVNLETQKALLLIDFQQGIQDLAASETLDFIPRIPELVSTFRDSGQVVWVKTVFRSRRSHISPITGAHSIILPKYVKKLRAQREAEEGLSSQDHGPTARLSLTDVDEAFLDGHQSNASAKWRLPQSAEEVHLTATLQDCVNQQKDIVFCKSDYSAFASQALMMQLRSRVVTHLYICGAMSNSSVYATVFDAVAQGFEVTLVEDCLGYANEACHIEAMTRMVDEAGAAGTDHQELMDELNDLLGEVIPPETFTRTFQLSNLVDAPRPMSGAEKISNWITEVCEVQTPILAAQAKMPELRSYDSFGASISVPPTPGCVTPLLKRVPSESDDIEEIPPSSLDNLTERAEHSIDTPTNNSKPTAKKPKRESLNPSVLGKTVPSPAYLQAIGQSRSASIVELYNQDLLRSKPHNRRTMSQPEPQQTAPAEPTLDDTVEYHSAPKKRDKYEPIYLEPNDKIGSGDSFIKVDALSSTAADEAFHALRENVKWQTMLHRTGAVPRLVACQGAIDTTGSYPIYRHPADESPALLPFSSDVLDLKRVCEAAVGHELNHVLIQLYRTGDDNISEHSDKTLDIVRGSSIVNLSLGAQRTMTLRTKKPADAASHPAEPTQRPSQRVRLPHGSMFVLGQASNANWLHAIRADKRLASERSAPELAFEGERISLTFRQIGTFLSADGRRIWGQGATGKTTQEAQDVLEGEEAAVEGRRMITAFGRENREDETVFEWEREYGGGFDVVNYVTKTE